MKDVTFLFTHYDKDRYMLKNPYDINFKIINPISKEILYILLEDSSTIILKEDYKNIIKHNLIIDIANISNGNYY